MLGKPSIFTSTKKNYHFKKPEPEKKLTGSIHWFKIFGNKFLFYMNKTLVFTHKRAQIIINLVIWSPPYPVTTTCTRYQAIQGQVVKFRSWHIPNYNSSPIVISLKLIIALQKSISY